MICPKCEKEGLKSKVYPGVRTSMLLHCQPYYDEDGKLHHHDRNTATTGYNCSNGHYWLEKSIGNCWCGWPDDV
jgi:hypothetical protein